MNWFQRYGIPGAYFVSLIGAWLFFTSPGSIHDLNTKDGVNTQVALAALSFLPIGYIISVIGQLIYLCTPLGVTGAALRRMGNPFIGFRDDPRSTREEILEARILLFVVARMPAIANQFTRDWIARRTDVCAINPSIIVASIAWILFAIGYSLRYGTSLTFAVFSLGGGVLLIIPVMCISYGVLRGQIIEAMVGIYRAYR